MPYEAAIPNANPLFRNGDLIIFGESDCIVTVPLNDLLHAYQLNADPDPIDVNLRIAGPWGPEAKIDLKITGTIEFRRDVPDHLIDVDPAGSHLASVVQVMRTLDKAARVLWAEAEPWEPRLRADNGRRDKLGRFWTDAGRRTRCDKRTLQRRIRA